MSSSTIKPPESSPSTESDDALQIRQARLASNEAIANRDAGKIVSFLHSHYQVSAGNGDLFHGTPAQKEQAWAQLFASYDDVSYRRTPESIDISRDLPLAYEQGYWTGSLRSDATVRTFAGRYSAAWRKTDGLWKIYAELFVTLGSTPPPELAGDTA